MANLYVRSTDGSDVDNGSTWALAKATVDGADEAPDAAGDNIFVSSVHSESNSANVTWIFAGTRPAPTKLLSVNAAAEPPTALAAGAVVNIAGSSGYSLNIQGNVYVYGVDLIFGSGTGGNLLYLGNSTGGFEMAFEDLDITFATTSGIAGIICGSGGNVPGNRISFKNCNFRFGAAGQGFAEVYHFLRWNGGSLLSGGTSPTAIFKIVGAMGSGRACNLLVENVDFSNAAAAVDLITNVGTACQAVFRNIKLPTSWSGDLVGGTIEVGAVVKLHNYTVGTTEYSMWEQHWSGSNKSDTAHYRTGGASDGTTAISWLMASTTNAAFPHSTLDSPEIVRWNATTGSAITVTVHVAQEGGSNLNDNDIWLEVNYLGTSGVWQGSMDDDDRCGLLATPAAQATSTETWTGFSSATKQKLEATFTPQEAGFIYARVRLAKPSTSIYVCPKVVIS